LLSRNVTPDRETERSFGEFVNDEVDTATGEISGRDALVQIAAMPILRGTRSAVSAPIKVLD
jgi:hypothetical protein